MFNLQKKTVPFIHPHYSNTRGQMAAESGQILDSLGVWDPYGALEVLSSVY